MSKKLIFLIDDDEVYNALNKRMLTKNIKFEYEIKEYTDPEVALKDILEKNIIPDFIFLDVNMPMMDGWEFLEILSEETEGQTLKTVVSMLTSSVFPNDKAKALTFDIVHHYYNKPLDPVSIKNIFED